MNKLHIPSDQVKTIKEFHDYFEGIDRIHDRIFVNACALLDIDPDGESALDLFDYLYNGADGAIEFDSPAVPAKKGKIKSKTKMKTSQKVGKI